VRIGPDGKIASISLRERFDAHRLIEEFMIQANVCAAETLEDRAFAAGLPRPRTSRAREKINNLSNFLPTVGLRWTRGEKITGSRFDELLADVRAVGERTPRQRDGAGAQAQARYAHRKPRALRPELV